ncbi:hypothetical protein SKAU_G00177230 [Synaphobranchus kaupii]|uniref:Uncharacterized protein n=1 Tax=Synaphobranchus kaupii TaxID=118154 RepID=A0A9Q1FLX0_SYNKA|nr:hypothetical protein SKAU_G00177230 [Synaphobranchus kaupii]
MCRAVQTNGKGAGSREVFVGVVSQLRPAQVRGVGGRKQNKSAEPQTRTHGSQLKGCGKAVSFWILSERPLGKLRVPSTSKGPKFDCSRALFPCKLKRCPKNPEVQDVRYQPYLSPSLKATEAAPCPLETPSQAEDTVAVRCRIKPGENSVSRPPSVSITTAIEADNSAAFSGSLAHIIL